jgi:hypothetical protein
MTVIIMTHTIEVMISSVFHEIKTGRHDIAESGIKHQKFKLVCLFLYILKVGILYRF